MKIGLDFSLHVCSPAIFSNGRSLMSFLMLFKVITLFKFSTSPGIHLVTLSYF